MTLGPLDAGRAALRSGEWAEARRAFEQALASGETPEALEGLGLAAWWLDQGDEVFQAGELEMVGRELHGFARVTAGSVAEGLRELDGVNAAVLAGEMRDRVLIGLACCYLTAACERIRDFERASQWCERLKVFCETWGL